METSKNVFVEDVTTKEAGIYALKYGYVFFRNIWRSLNEFVHSSPWLCVGVVIIASVVISCYHVASARAERDMACQKQLELQEKVEGLSIALETKK